MNTTKTFIDKYGSCSTYFKAEHMRDIIRQIKVMIVNVNIRMYNFDDVQCTVIPSVAYGVVTGMNLQLC